MGRNKLVKRIVLLLLAATCFVSFLIFFNIYFINSSQTFSSWEYLQEETKDFIFVKDPEIVELEKKISYILKIYKDERRSNFGLGLSNNNKNVPDFRQELKFKNFRNHFEKKDSYGIGNSKSRRSDKKLSEPKIQQKVSFPDKKKSESVSGVLNAHIWEGWCGPRVEDLKRDKHFPLFPSFKTNLSLFFSQWNEAGYGERIFGYIHPPETGNYIFAVSCDDNCEVWLSNSSDPHFVEKIAYVGTLNTPANTKVANFRQYQSQISKQVNLVAGQKYYIEVLHKQAAYKDHLLLTWLAPTWQRIRTISSKYISSFLSAEVDTYDIEDYAMYIPETPATFRDPNIYSNVGNIYYFNRTKYKFGSNHNIFQDKWTYIIDDSDFTNILPLMDHKPSYIIDFVPKRYEGVKLIHETSVYPDDNTALTHMYNYEDCLSHRQTHPHLSELFPGNSLKTAIDEENWFSQLTFDRKFKYLLKMYTKKLSESNPDYNEDGEKYADVITRGKRYDFSIPKINIKTEPIADKDEKLTSKYGENKDFLNSYKSKFSSNEKSDKNPTLGPIHFKGRKLMNFEDDNSTSFKLTERYLDKVLHNEKAPEINDFYAKKLRKKYDSQKMDNDGLPSNMFENNIREKPISIPSFVRARKDEVNEDNDESLTPTAFYSAYNNRVNSRKYSNSRRKLETEPMIKQKIYFKDGVYYNGTNITSADHYNMAWLYKIFGSAIYHLSQVPERYFQWLYNQHLSDCKTDGNLQLSEEIAVNVVNDYMEVVKSKYGSKYKLKTIVNVEENHDIIYGDRYLIEMDLTVENQEITQRLSRYVYRPVGSDKLFEINDFSWNPQATVHIIIPVKDQGRWVKHFIDNIEKIYTEQSDSFINIILVDFNSTDINIKRCLEKSKLKRYQVISLDGPFQRALGVQAGADAVTNPNDIIFTCDLHLEIPSLLIDSIRKHTIKNHMAFAPMVFRLSCGYTPELPFGLWEIQGYGLFSISKYDFDRIGGMNTKEFKTKWGGEDWEFLDRVLEFGLEVERMRIPQFYHYYHSKKRMWVSPKTTLPPMVDVDT